LGTPKMATLDLAGNNFCPYVNYTGYANSTDASSVNPNCSYCANFTCLNNGYCNVDPLGTYGFTCYCQGGYYGMYCDTPIVGPDQCVPNPCNNGGTCGDLQNGYMCLCATGFNGTNCSYNQHACDGPPCQNGGVCTLQPNASYTCNCTNTGYNGQNCTVLNNNCPTPNPCLNNGTCVNAFMNYTCNCTSEFNGTVCQNDIGECRSSPCQNGGNCTNIINGTICTCPSGYNGSYCQNDINQCRSSPC